MSAGASSVVCVGVYKSPNTNKELYFEEINELLEIINVYNNKTFVVGDFNIKLLGDSSPSSKFLDIMLTHGLYPVIFKLTRPASGSLLDNIFVTSPAPLSSHVVSYELSDLCPIIAVFNDLINMNKKSTLSLKRKFTKYALDNFINKLSHENWEDVYKCQNANNVYKKFLKFFGISSMIVFTLASPIIKNIQLVKNHGLPLAYV